MMDTAGLLDAVLFRFLDADALIEQQRERWAMPLAIDLLCLIAKSSRDRAAVLVAKGYHDAVTPLGSPVTERFTWPANPYCGFT